MRCDPFPGEVDLYRLKRRERGLYHDLQTQTYTLTQPHTDKRWDVIHFAVEVDLYRLKRRERGTHHDLQTQTDADTWPHTDKRWDVIHFPVYRSRLKDEQRYTSWLTDTDRCRHTHILTSGEMWFIFLWRDLGWRITSGLPVPLVTNTGT